MNEEKGSPLLLFNDPVFMLESLTCIKIETTIRLSTIQLSSGKWKDCHNWENWEQLM